MMDLIVYIFTYIKRDELNMYSSNILIQYGVGKKP